MAAPVEQNGAVFPELRAIVFRRLRIAILLYILVFVAVGELLASRRSTDWEDTLWVGIWLVNAEGSAAAAKYVDGLASDDFREVETFFADQARTHGVALEQPFRIRIAGRLDDPMPPLPQAGDMLGTIWWSLRMRWLVTRLNWATDGPAPDITVFALYHDEETGVALDRSTALEKGLIALANLYADRARQGPNRMIVAHELLHTLGATDKYDGQTNHPIFPAGYAEPGLEPLHPQSQAELMAGRIPVSASSARIPLSLKQVVVGPTTAAEIGWLRP